VNMIGKISTALAERQINIEHIVNRSKGDYAYTMVDIGDVDPAVVQEVTEFLREQEGIVRVRVIGGQ
jgi:D-3-phosphoglycerate dehydrogenase